MIDNPCKTGAEGRELWLERRIDAPPERLFAAWTQPELVRRWFAPAPWSVSAAETDLRVGGATQVVMRGPDGQNFQMSASISTSSRIGEWSLPTLSSTPGPLRKSRS